MDLSEMMAQAKELQAKVSAVQDSLGDILVKGLAGNGAVIVEMTGKYDIKQVIISDAAMKYSASELSKIVRDAFLDAKGKADTIIDEKMSRATAGVNLPF